MSSGIFNNATTECRPGAQKHDERLKERVSRQRDGILERRIDELGKSARTRLHEGEVDAFILAERERAMRAKLAEAERVNALLAQDERYFEPCARSSRREDASTRYQRTSLHQTTLREGGLAVNAPIAGEQPTCFVIGPIGNRNAEIGTEERARFEESIQVWEKVIEPGCRAVGLEPIRADLIARAGEIPEQIFRSLRDADAVVADLSGGNPNVMYELGLRHSKSKVTIQIGEAGRLPFDVAAIRTIEFRRTDGSLFEARDALTEVLREGLAGRFDLVTATRVWLGVEVEEEREPTEESQEDEELGFLELLANMEEQLPQVVITLQSIAGTSQELTDVMNAVAGEVTASDEAGGGARARLVIAIWFADQLADFAARTEHSRILTNSRCRR